MGEMPERQAYYKSKRQVNCNLFSDGEQELRAAARQNVKKAAAAAKRKRTIAHLPKKRAHCAGQGRR
jgi:hypothetical protein